MKYTDRYREATHRTIVNATCGSLFFEPGCTRYHPGQAPVVMVMKTSSSRQVRKPLLIVAICFAFLSLCYFAQFLFSSWGMGYVPHTRDKRLVGTWISTSAGRTRYELRNDGTGGGHRSLRWGTSGKLLYLRYFSVDSWESRCFEYEVSVDGRQLNLFETWLKGDVESFVRY